MTKVDILKQNGEKSGDISLDEMIFGLKPNNQILNQSLSAQRSNSREGNAHAKTRAEVRGGGKKPWKQKGTGNARAGSSRSPLWIGGGVTFGPRNTRNFKKRLPSKFKKNGIFMALSEKVTNHKLIILNDLKLDKISTKNALGIIEKLPIKEGSILIVTEKQEPKAELSFRNLSFVKTLSAGNLNTYDIVKFDYLVITKDAINKIKEVFTKKITTDPKETKPESDKKPVVQDKTSSAKKLEKKKTEKPISKKAK